MKSAILASAVLLWAFCFHETSQSAANDDDDDDAVVVNAEGSKSNTPKIISTQTGGNEFTSGVLGFGLGAGSVLLAQAFLDSQKNQPCRVKRQLEFLGNLFGGGNKGNSYNCNNGYRQPGGFPPGSPYQQPLPVSSSNQRPFGYQQPISGGYQQPISSGYHQPLSSGYQQPISGGYRPPISAGYQQPISSNYNPSAYSPVSSQAYSGPQGSGLHGRPPSNQYVPGSFNQATQPQFGTNANTFPSNSNSFNGGSGPFFGNNNAGHFQTQDFLGSNNNFNQGPFNGGSPTFFGTPSGNFQQPLFGNGQNNFNQFRSAGSDIQSSNADTNLSGEEPKDEDLIVA